MTILEQTIKLAQNQQVAHMEEIRKQFRLGLEIATGLDQRNDPHKTDKLWSYAWQHGRGVYADVAKIYEELSVLVR